MITYEIIIKEMIEKLNNKLTLDWWEVSDFLEPIVNLDSDDNIEELDGIMKTHGYEYIEDLSAYVWSEDIALEMEDIE